MLKKSISNQRGFSLIELSIVIVILGILVLLAIPRINGAVEIARLNTDKANVRILNGATSAYRIENYTIGGEDVFSGLTTDAARIQELVDSSFILETIVTMSEDAKIIWNVDQQIWYLYINSEPVMLTQFGNTFMEVAQGFIDTIIKNYEENGSYGRTWGDYRFTDLGIDPDDWDEAFSHYEFRPSGSDLLVTPEEGFTPSVKLITGEVKTVYTNYNIIYDVETEKWYYRAVSPENEVDINTLQLVP